MARLFGAHRIELKPGVSAEQFERFVKEEWRAPAIPGVKVYVLKGDRGERVGGYTAIIECDSVATRDRYWPTPGGVSEEWKQIQERAAGDVEQRRIADKWNALASAIGGGVYTDWEVIAE